MESDSAAAAARRPIRLMTWNIHGGLGPDGRFDLARVVHIIRAHDPDIIALQEVDSRGRGNGPDSPFTFLASALGIHAAAAHTIVAPDGHYGHLLISRWGLSGVTLHDLSHARCEKRCGIEAMVHTPQGKLHVTAVHLGLRITERRFQAAKLANIAATGGAASVMMGDFNDWWRGSVKRALERELPDHSSLRTFPAARPLLMLDRIYCRPAGALLRAWTDRAARDVSDHLPVMAELNLPTAA